MSINHDIPGVEVFGKGRQTYTLPCGYVDGLGKVHRQIVMREMTGAEEDLMDEDGVSATDRISNILSACCEKLGDITDRELIARAVNDKLEPGEGLPLTASDRVAMLLFLRRVSVGDTYRFSRDCPHCGAKNSNLSLNLAELDIREVKDPTKRKVKFKLPSGIIAVLKVLSASGERKLTELKPDQKDVRTLAILARLESLNEQPITKHDLQKVKSLSMVDRNYIREVYNLIEGAVDTDIEMTCRACKKDFIYPLDLGQVFFSNQSEKVTVSDLEWV